MTENDNCLIHYNQLGLIAGPLETKEEFSKRAQYCLALKENFFQLASGLISSTEQIDYPIFLKNSCSTLIPYQFSCPWVPLVFSNHDLLPWHGGSAWIFQVSEDTPTSAFIQLRKAFKSQDRYLFFYTRQELIAHECCHIGRMMFEEPMFEELLAYRLSSSWLRRFVGPLIQSRLESFIIGLMLVLWILTDGLGLLWSGSIMFGLALGVKIFAGLCLGLAFLRLIMRHSTLDRCLLKLNTLFSEHAEAVLFRLTDREIISFSKMTYEQIKFYIQQDDSVRWQQIKGSYSLHQD